MTYLQVFAALHQILDIINNWEVQAKDLKEVHLLLRQVGVGENLDQVSKVIATLRKNTQRQDKIFHKTLFLKSTDQ